MTEFRHRGYGEFEGNQEEEDSQFGRPPPFPFGSPQGEDAREESYGDAKDDFPRHGAAWRGEDEGFPRHGERWGDDEERFPRYGGRGRHDEEGYGHRMREDAEEGEGGYGHRRREDEVGYPRPPPPSDFPHMGYSSHHPEEPPFHRGGVQDEYGGADSYRQHNEYDGEDSCPPSSLKEEPLSDKIAPVVQSDSSDLPQGRLVKIFCKENSDFNLTVEHNSLKMQQSNTEDEAQQWIKDASHGMRVKDSYGYPAFSLVNKKTKKMLKHTNEEGLQVLLIDYQADIKDDGILWTESQDFGEGFKTVRSASNTLLNLTVFEGNKRIRNGSALVLDTWHKGDHQLWKLFPL